MEQIRRQNEEMKELKKQLVQRSDGLHQVASVDYTQLSVKYEKLQTKYNQLK